MRKLLRQIQEPAKFIFMDMILADNIQHLTENIGFKDDAQGADRACG